MVPPNVGARALPLLLVALSYQTHVHTAHYDALVIMTANVGLGDLRFEISVLCCCCRPQCGLNLIEWATRAIRVVNIDLLPRGRSGRESLQDRCYVFTPEFLHAIAQAAVREHPGYINAMIPCIVSNISAEFPFSTTALNTNFIERMLSNAGGVMGAVYSIHTSMTEYLMIVGASLVTEGHTGMHTVHDYFNILVGEQWAFNLPKLERKVSRPGSVHH
ncbi:hypothetical protein GY45DRAFT_1383236 [Cubamyces sp. BRFM 1775]|nr:hypothetical protein GY45DRAFT_1383236 [Cubamyces sp. BRFM 1775]